MLNEQQRSRLIAMAADIKAGLATTSDLDALTESLRQESAQAFHPTDRDPVIELRSLRQRVFYDEPVSTAVSARSFVRPAPPPAFAAVPTGHSRQTERVLPGPPNHGSAESLGISRETPWP